MDRLKRIQELQRESAELSRKLERSLIIEDILKTNGIDPIKWPIRSSFSGYPRQGIKAVFCSFKDRSGDIILRLPASEIPEKLWPEQLKTDLKRR